MSNKQWPWRWFSPDESGMFSPDTRECRMDPEFMDRLDALRYAFGMSLRINSGYRTAAHNRAIGGSPRSAHLDGRAVDIQLSDPAQMPRLINKAYALGFTGFGLLSSQALHLDDMDGTDRPRPRMWTYP